MVEVYGAELSGRRLIHSLSIRPPLRNCVHVIGQSQRDNISFNTVDYRRRLFT